MVILETAIAIPVLTAVAIVLAWAISIGGAALSMGDAVRVAARELARGEAPSAVLEQARMRETAADFDVVIDGGRVAVSARRQIAPPIPLLNGLRITVQQSADVPMEWS